MEKCGSGNVNWVCTQLFGLADLLQSGYGTCFVRISCFSNLLFWSNTCFLENVTFLVCLEQNPTTKMTVRTMGSFHGFGKKWSRHWFLLFRSHFLRMTPIFDFPLQLYEKALSMYKKTCFLCRHKIAIFLYNNKNHRQGPRAETNLQ